MRKYLRKTLVGMFADTGNARRAVYALQAAGFPLEEVSVAMRERYDSVFQTGTAGTLLSLSVGNQASTTPMDYGRTKVKGLEPATEEVAPGYGPMIAAGPLARGLGGAALGVAAGGIAGALSDIGITNEVARNIVDLLRAGERTMVCIQVERADAERVEKLFLDNGAETVYRSTDHTGDYYEGSHAAEAAEMGF